MDKILSKYEAGAETGLHYAEACYYDSQLSTFNSTDCFGSGSAVTDGKGYRYKNGDTKKLHIFSIELSNKCLMIVVLYISNIILKQIK